MASSAAYDALRGYLEAHFTSAPLFFENEEVDPPETAATWVYVEIESDEDDQESIGSGNPDAELWREHGVLRAHVLVPVGAGVAAGNATRDAIAQLFRGLQIDSLICRAIHRRGGLRWEEFGVSNGNWWALPLTVDWYLDH